MRFYCVVKPCVVGNLHYVSIQKHPIIAVDDDVAAPLVDEGCLIPYEPGPVPPVVKDPPRRKAPEKLED